MDTPHTPGARGIQMEQVWAAADAVLATGQRPTIERVRQHLGRGSPNTVAPLLEAWYAALAPRLSATGAAANPLPEPVQRAAQLLWQRALQQAQVAATQEFQERCAQLEQAQNLLAQERAALLEREQRLAERAQALTTALQAKDAQIQAQVQQIQELQSARQQAVDEWGQTQKTLDAVQQSMQVQLQHQHAQEALHRQEREQQEQRAQAQERRWLTEIDRARLHAKDLAAQWSAQEKKYTAQLSQAQQHNEEVTAAYAALQTEHQGVQAQLTLLQAQWEQKMQWELSAPQHQPPAPEPVWLSQPRRARALSRPRVRTALKKPRKA